MTNSQIIYNAALAHGFTDAQLSQLLEAYNSELPFHTFQEWKSRGYNVKKGAHALFTAALWKHTDKPSRAAKKAAEEDGKDVPESSPHYYKKVSHLFSYAQVEKAEKSAPAPDLVTIKADRKSVV